VVGRPSVSRSSRLCGNLDGSQPYESPRPVAGTVSQFATSVGCGGVPCIPGEERPAHAQCAGTNQQGTHIHRVSTPEPPTVRCRRTATCQTPTPSPHVTRLTAQRAFDNRVSSGGSAAGCCSCAHMSPMERFPSFRACVEDSGPSRR
jgi:hypothetical protein